MTPNHLLQAENEISVWEDLKRRNVYRVGVGYAALAWLTIEVSETILPRVGLPDWSVTMVIVVAMIGLPVALFLGWTLEITPKGIVFDKPRHVGWPTYLVIDLTIVAILAAAGGIYWFRVHEIDTPVLAQAENSIAVLRFLNIGDNPSNGYLSDGLTEELIHELTNLQSFKVAARTSVWAVSAADLEVTDIANRLNVKRVLEGSVRSDGDQVRVTAQLIDSDGFHLWSKSYDRQMKDVLDIQKDIAAQVVNELDVLLTDKSQSRLASQPTLDSAAYDQYLHGQHFLRQPSDLDSLASAESFFAASIGLDNRFSLAYAGLCETQLARYRLTRDTENFEAAELACHRALTLDEGLAEVYTALGNLYRHAGLSEKAEGEYRAALAISPTLEAANYGLGRSYQAQGRLEAAEETLKESIELEPGYWGSYMGFGNFLHRQGRYAEAVPYYEKVTQLAPDYAGGFINLGSALHWLGDWGAAEVAWSRSLELNPDSMAYQNMGTLYYYQERFKEAAEMHEKAVAIAPSDHRSWGKLASALRFVPDQEERSQGAYKYAIAFVQSRLAVNPDEPEDLSYLSYYLVNTDQLDAAREVADRALSLAPGNPSTHYFAAIAELRSGNIERALFELNEAVNLGYSTRMLETDPDFERVWQHIEFMALTARSANERAP